MSYYPNPNRHVYIPSSSHTRVSVRPNLSWSTIQEESSSDLLTPELNEKQERINRLKKLERLKERRYMDYQSLKRRGSSKEYSERFQRDCEEFNKLKYRQVHHKRTSLHVPPSKHRSISVSDVTNRHYFTSSRYGRSHLRGNQDDGQTLSPTGSISSIVTLDDDYMYGSRYSAEDHWASWQPRSRTSSFSTSMARDRLSYYGLSSHEMLDDNLFDDASSEYSFSGYMPQRRAFSSSVTPRRYTGLMTPTAQSADAVATEERMNQLSERLRTLQNERLQLERRRSVDLSSSHMRSHLPSSDHTEMASASVYSRFNQNNQTNILPQSPTDHSVPAWSQRVNLLLSPHPDVPDLSSDVEYSGSHFEYGSRYLNDRISRTSSELPDSASQSFHSTDVNESRDRNYNSPTKSSTLSRSFIYQKPEISSTPLSTSTFETRQERISMHFPSHLSMTTADTHQESIPFGASHGDENTPFRHANVRRVFNANLQQPTNGSPTHVLRDGQLTGADSNRNFQRTSEKSSYITDMPHSPLSPESRKSFMAFEKKSVLTQPGQQWSQPVSQDEINDSGAESTSDVGRGSSRVSSDSVSKFLVSASKPSESRGVTKFEMGLESPDQRAYGSRFSPGGATYQSVQEGTARDNQDSISYSSPRTSSDAAYSLESQHLQDSKMDIQATKQNDTDEGRHDSVEADKAISGGVGIVTHKERIVEFEHPASTKLVTVNVGMEVSQDKLGDSSHQPDDQIQDISQPQRTKTMVLPQTKELAQKKQVSSEVEYTENKLGTTATLKMATRRREEFAEEPSAQLEQSQSFVWTGQKQPEETTHDIKKTFADSPDALRKGVKAAMPIDNSSIFQPHTTASETRRMENTTTTSTVVEMVDNYSREQIPGINVPYNQNSSQSIKSNGLKDTMFQGTVTTSEVSVTMPPVRKTERSEIHAKSPDDMDFDNLSKSLASSNQAEMSQIVYKTVSDKLESGDVYVQKSIDESSPNVTENIQEIYTSKVIESKFPEEQNVSELNVITPKKKKSKKKKSLKGVENNGLDSSPKPEEPMKTTVNLEFCPSVTDGDKIQPKTNVSSPEIIRVAADNIPKTDESQEKNFSTTAYMSSTGMATTKVDSLQEIYQNGTKESLGGTFSISNRDLPPKPNLADKKRMEKQQSEKDMSSIVDTDDKISEAILQSDVKVVKSKLDESLDTGSQNQAAFTAKKQPVTGDENESEVKTFTLKSPQQADQRVQYPSETSKAEQFKSGTDVTVSKKQFQTPSTDRTATVTIVETKELMDATRESFDQLQFIDQKSSIDVVKNKTPSPISSKLKTTSYKMTASVDNVYIQEPGRSSKERPAVISESMYKKLEEKHPSLETAKPKYLIQDIPGKVPSEEKERTTKEKSKKKKKNSSKTPSKEKENEQSGTFPGESAQIKTTKQNEVSPKIPSLEKDANLRELTEHIDSPEKVIITSTTVTKISETPESYSIQSASGEFPNQGTLQTEFTQGNMADKNAAAIKMAGYKMDPGMLDKSVEYKLKSVSAEFPGQQAELGKDEELITKVVTTAERTSYDMNSGMQSGPEVYNIQSVSGKLPENIKDPKLAGFQEQGDMFGKVTTTTKTIAYKTSEMPEEEYNVQKMSAEFPGQVEGPKQMEFTQGNLVDKVATITKTSAYKISPGMSERPEEYHVQSISAEFPDQIKSPMQTDFTQGNIVDKAAPTINMGTYKMSPGMSERPEEYNVQSVSAQFPGQIKSPMQTNFSQGNIVDKSAPTIQMATYKMAPGMPERPEEYSVQTISAEFPEQIKSSMQTDFTQGNIADKATPTFNTSAYKMAPGMSDNPEVYKLKSLSAELPAQQAELGKDGELITKVTTTTETISYEVVPGSGLSMGLTSNNSQKSEFNNQYNISTEETLTTKPITMKTSERPEELQVPSVSTELPESSEDLHKTGDAKTSFFDRVASTLKSTFSKISPGVPDNHELPTSSISGVSAKHSTSVDPVEDTEDQTSDNRKASIELEENNGLASPTIKEVTSTAIRNVTTKALDSDKVELPQVTEQGDIPTKLINLAMTKSTTHKEPDGNKDYTVQSSSVEFPGQGPQQSECLQGNIIDKVATTINTVAYKTSDKPEDYEGESISVKFPGQKVELKKDEEMTTKVVTTTETTSYEVDLGMKGQPVHSMTEKFPEKNKDHKQTRHQEQGDMFGKVTTTTKTIAYKTSEMPEEEFNVQKMSAEFPGQVEGPKQMEFTQGNLVDKVATITKTPVYKISPGMFERPEEYHVQSISAEFPDQIKSPMQTDFTQGNIVDKAAPTINMGTYKMSPGMSERPEDYHFESISAEFPGQIKSPMQTEFSQGNIVDKSAPTIQMATYKMAPGMSERPEEYSVQTISAEFPGEIKSPMQTEFSQGNIVDKAAPTIQMATYQMAPGMSERPIEYNVQSISAQLPKQIKSPTQTDFTQGYHVDKLVTTTVSTDIEMVPQVSDDFSDNASGTRQPGIKDQVRISNVSTTETFSENTVPEILQNVHQAKVSPTSKLFKEASLIEQGDMFGKVGTLSEDVVYKRDERISEKPVALKAQTVSAEFPGVQEKTGMITEVDTTGKPSANKTEEIPAELAKKKSKSHGKTGAATKKGTKKMSEMPEESNTDTVPIATSQQPKEKQKKEKPGFLGKVATSLKSTFSKKSPVSTIKSEEFPELVKDTVTVDSNAPNVPSDSQKVSYKSVVESGTVSPTVKTKEQKTADNKQDTNLGKDSVDGKVTATDKMTDKVITEITGQYNIQCTLPESPQQFKGAQDTNIPEENNYQSLLAEIPGQRKDAKQRKSKKQADLPEKNITTTTITKISETPESYSIQSASGEFPNQGTLQTEFTQGNMADKNAAAIKMAGYKMDPGMLDKSVEYKLKSVSAEFPGQQAELGKDEELITKVVTTAERTSYDMNSRMQSGPEVYNIQSVSGKLPENIKDPKLAGFQEQGDMFGKVTTTTKTIAYKTSEMPEEEYNVQKMSAEFPGQVEGPKQMEFTQGNLVDKVATITKTSAYKISPGMFERPEEYHVQSISAEFPDQIKSPVQTDFTQGNIVDKAAPTINMGTYKMSPGMSERPEEYNVQSVSAQFPGQIKSPMQTNFSQGNIVDKSAPTIQMATYKMAPGMPERPVDYHVECISAEFPGQIKSPMQTEFNQGYGVDKVATTPASAGHQMVPEMSNKRELKVPSMPEEFPNLLEGPKYDEPSSLVGTPYMSQVSYKSVLERGIKPMEHVVPPTTQSTDISVTTKTSQPNISYTLKGEQPDEKSESLETLHFTLEKPVTTVKPFTHTGTTDLTDFSVDKSTDFSVKSGITQIQEPTSTLSQYDPRYVVPSISTELPEKLKSSDIDASVSYSTDFSPMSAGLAPKTQPKTWSDVVKKGKTVDVSLERSQPNISPSVSIDKVEKSGDRSPHILQTENEDRTMSGASETFAITTPKGTSLPGHADISSGDVVAPLKGKPLPSARPLLRKLSGQDFSVTDIQKTAKPALKLVAPDCTLLQTKFETDGWKPKVKSPTITRTMTATIVQSEVISPSLDGDVKTQTPDLEHSSVLAPVAPKRRSREFRSMSEESTDGESTSPTTTLHFKTQVDIPVSSPQSHPPQAPKRRPKKGSKSNSGSMSPDVSGSKNLNLDDSKHVSQPEFRMSDQDVFRDSLPGSIFSLESETKQNLMTEKVISLNKSPHVSINSDSVNVENLEIKMEPHKVTPKPHLTEMPQSYFVLDDSPTEKNPPFERSYSADKSRTLPLHRKKIGSNSNNSDSDSEEKKQQPLSPNSNQKRWKSVEFFKDNQIKPDVTPKNTGLNRVKSTSIKLLSKLQPKSKKVKSPRPDKDEEDYSPGPHVKTGHGTTKEYPTLEKYPGNKNKEPSSPRTPNSEKFQAAAAPVAPLTIPLPLEENEEPVKERVYLSSWDPTPLLKELYEIRLMDDDTEDLSYKFIEMEGLMEKLPMNKKKATLLKTWKRRYFRAKNGWLVYYDNRNDEKPSDELLLMGGQIHAMGNQVIGIDDGGGRYLMVRCPSQKEYEQWLTALESQVTDNTRATYVRPSVNALKHPNKKVIMIEFGSMSIRAGILKENATLPQLFFPNTVAVSSENNMIKHVIGFDAYKPEVRHSSQLVQPFGPTDKVDKFKVDFDTLPSVFTAIFKDLKIATEEYYVMLILPLNIRDEEKSILMNILINQFKVCGVCMAPQALLALYSYNTQSGIIVDIGERLEVLPIYEGFVIDGGHTVQSFGAPKIRQSLRSGLTSENYPLYSPLEQLLVRLVLEQTCFVSKNFHEDCQQYQKNPEKFRETLYLKKYNIPDEIYTTISHSLSRFVSPEGLFNTDLWGMDYPTIQSLVMNAIQACPLDNRRHLCRSIYLSGGVTLLPGFASRLESELRKHLNETIVIQVHASPQRYHAAYIGACALCSMSEFEKSCITSEEWKKDGTKAFQKWKMTS